MKQNSDYLKFLKDKRVIIVGPAESLLENKHYLLAIKAYNFLIEKGGGNYFFIQSSINKLYAETKIIEEKKKT